MNLSNVIYKCYDMYNLMNPIFSSGIPLVKGVTMVSSPLFCTHCGAANQAQAAFCYACGQAIQAPVNVFASNSSGPLRIGALLKQRYQIMEQIGAGGFGAVYKAEDVDLGRRLVAVKEMSQQGLHQREIDESVEAFKHEALMLAGLRHEHLPRIYDHFEENERWYLVMDSIEGETLAEHFKKSRDGSLPLVMTMRITLQLCEVLDYLHTRQPPIIFRDLKPSNVILTPEGDVFLVDFGIARHFKPGQTKDTIAFGSPGYAAPEQYGKAQTTPRSDTFSLGAVLHQMLTGSDPSEKPFRFAPLTMPRPAGLSSLIERMVDMDESNRPPSMEVIKRELTVMLDGQTPWRDDELSLTGAYSPPAGTSTGARAATGPVAQPAGYSGPPIQPLQGSMAPQPAQKKKGKAGCLVGLAVAALLIWQIVSGIVSHSPTTFQSYPGTSSTSYTPVDQPTDTAVPTGGFQATGTPSFSDAPVYSVAWSPDGALVASGGADSSVAVWDVRTGERQSLGLINAYGKTYSVAWSPDGRYLAAGTGSTLQIWTFPQMSYDSYDTSASITSLSWSPDNEHLVLGSDDG